MPRPVPGPGALVWYIQTGDRDARITYRELPEKERLEYRDTVNRVYANAIAHHFGDAPDDDEVDDLIERLADRHPQYAGGVNIVLRSLMERSRRLISPRQTLTAKHLIIREIAKLHPGFRERADQIVAEASRHRLPSGVQEEAAASALNASFSGVDPDRVVSLMIGLDCSLLSIELLRGAERMGGRSIAACVVRAWVIAERQRWSHAKLLGVHDSIPEPGSGATRGERFLSEAYSPSRLVRATVDPYGRLRSVTFMRNGLFGDDGRYGLAAEIRVAIDGAQAALKASL